MPVVDLGRLYATAMFGGTMAAPSFPIAWNAFPVRVVKVLHQLRIATDTELAGRSWQDLCGQKNCGLVSLRLIALYLEKRNYSPVTSLFLYSYGNHRVIDFPPPVEQTDSPLQTA